MWVKVIHRRRVPRVGEPGDVVQLGRRAAKVLIAVGRVAPCDAPGAAAAPPQPETPKTEKPREEKPKATKKVAKKTATKKVTKKGTYKRRDLRAESSD